MIELSPEGILEAGVPPLQAGAEYVVKIPMPNIASAALNIDIASDYSWAIFAAEQLKPHVKRIVSRGLSRQYPYTLDIVFTPENVPECVGALNRIAVLFDEDQPPEAEETRIAANFFEGDLADTTDIALPDWGDAFLANYIPGLAQMGDEEQLENYFRAYPSWRFGFWKSFLSHELGEAVYASTDGWILPRAMRINRFLRALRWGRAESRVLLQPAELVRSGSRPWILVNDKQCVFVPVRVLNNAAACWQFSLHARRPKSIIGAFEFGESPPGDYLSEHDDSEWMVSSDGSIVTVAVFDVQFVAFIDGSARLRPEQTAEYLHATKDAFAALAKHCFADKPLDWTQLGPSEFEELCYQVLVKCERFDPDRMRKIGNAKSRDGGRDIEAWTYGRPGAAAQKWIFQCKFSADKDASLGGLRSSVSDVVDQFGADGYGVMTNMLIDATLYDKLDGICQTRARAGRVLHVETWSRLEMERFLSDRVDLLARFFRR